MNGRALATEITALAAATLWVYGGVSLAVAVADDGASVSFGAVVAVVSLSYGLARLLQRIDMTERATRVVGVGLSVVLLYVILRIDIAGEPYLWKMGWLVDLLSDPARTLDGHGGEIAEVALLGAAWAWSVARGARDLTPENVLDEVSLGILVVLLAVAFAPATDAPGALLWLPVPYMVTVLLTLALLHLSSVETGNRPFLGVWALWTGGSLSIIAGLAVLATLFDPPSLSAAGHALVWAFEGLVLLVGYVVAPFIIAAGWVTERLIDWLVSGGNGTRDTIGTGQPPGPLPVQEGEPARWVEVLGYVLRSGLIVLVIAVALAVLWFAFQRLAPWRREGGEVREEVDAMEGGHAGDLRTILSGALGRLRPAGWPRGRDAIGRLYLSMLRRAAGEGLPRPPAATPLEFALRLEEHFGSPTPGSISRAFAEARYGRRPPPREEIERLRARWEVDSRR